MFYRFQGAMKMHSITYSLMIDTLIGDSKEIELLQNAVKKVPVLAKKNGRALDWFWHAPFHIRY